MHLVFFVFVLTDLPGFEEEEREERGCGGGDVDDNGNSEDETVATRSFVVSGELSWCELLRINLLF